MWPWLGQRVTAVVILVTILVHLVLTHFVAIGELSYDDIGERLAMTAVLVNDVLLLVAVTFHALNGVRMVVLDYGFKSTGARRGLAVFLWLVGILGVVYGIWALWVWVS
jgi:succinate dehydrogenase / fumarate reductase cytochrome b subunit